MPEQLKSVLWTMVFLTILPVATGCSESRDHAADPTPGRVLLQLDKKNEKLLLRYFVGGMTTPGGSDPFQAGFVVEQSGRYYLVSEKLLSRFPYLKPMISAITADDRIDWDEFEQLVDTSYYRVRAFPRTLEELAALVGDWRAEDGWFRVDVRGVMTPSRRRIHVQESRLRGALQSYTRNGGRIVYSMETTFVSEHIAGDTLQEVSVMRKRSDGFWDYMAYGPRGNLMDAIPREPVPLRVPSKCIGCHFGNKLFEPEKSFPARARPGPEGPRALFVDEMLRDATVTRLLDEHRKRSDTILGLYGTLFLSSLRAQREAGTLSSEDDSLLVAFGL